MKKFVILFFVARSRQMEVCQSDFFLRLHLFKLEEKVCEKKSFYYVSCA